MKNSITNKSVNVSLYIKIIEAAFFVFSVILMIDIFNNAEILNFILISSNLIAIQNLIEVMNIVLVTLIVVFMYYNLSENNIVNRYVLIVAIIFFLILEIYRYIFQSNLILINILILITFLCFLLDNIDYFKKHKISKKYIIMIVSVILYIIIQNQLILKRPFLIGELIGIITIVIILLIIYRTLKYKGSNYLITMGLLIMLIVYFITMHRVLIDNKVFLLSYHLMKLLSFICIFVGVFYHKWEKNHESISQREKQIKLYAEKINIVVDKRTAQLESMNTKLNEDLEYAKIIQQSLLPNKWIDFSDVIFVSNYYPCEKLSGDFYDIFRIDNKHIGMYILDVSGHGVSAAMLTMFCKNSIISGERLIRRYRGLKPHRNLQHFYETFNNAKFPSETHMVMLFASYSVDTRVLKYSSGGLNCYPIVIKENGNVYELSENDGFPISRFGEFYTPEYTSSSTILDIGDIVFFYTDGLTDFTKNKIITYPDLLKLFIEIRNAEKISEVLDEMIEKHKNRLEDDVTYFIMEVK